MSFASQEFAAQLWTVKWRNWCHLIIIFVFTISFATFITSVCITSSIYTSVRVTIVHIVITTITTIACCTFCATRTNRNNLHLLSFHAECTLWRWRWSQRAFTCRRTLIILKWVWAWITKWFRHLTPGQKQIARVKIIVRKHQWHLALL